MFRITQIRLRLNLKKNIVVFFLLAIVWCKAQEKLRFYERELVIKNQKGDFRLDSLSIVASSFEILDSDGNNLDTNSYDINFLTSILKLKNNKPEKDIYIRYTTFTSNLSETYFHKSDQLIETKTDTSRNPFSTLPQEEYTTFFPSNGSGLAYSGSLTRGVAFGNNQDVSLNSDFNLQLSGKINNDVEIVAALTDNNIPIQPEGNTQNIQDFDNVFVQLSKNQTQVTVGDFQIKEPKSYFLKYNKKTQGIGVVTDVTSTEQYRLKAQADVGISRGRFGRNQFLAQEGNQGPYKLQGANGENFIVILSGTEQIFIDGKLLKRGADQDYIIDYNTGEVTFMPNMLITKDIRINVEFQYTDQAYLRSLMSVGTYYQKENLEIRTHFFSEQDAKNQPLQREFSSVDKEVLTEVGDQQALVDGFDVVAFNEDLIMYELIEDTLIYDSVFVYSNNPEKAKYTVSFSFVGQNKGNYSISNNIIANGRVYQWKAPVNGVPQGEYEPVVVLVSPKREQMWVNTIQYQMDKSSSITTELAISNYNENTFSKKDNEDNIGSAFHTAYTKKWGEDTAAKIEWITNVDYEYRSVDFNPIQRYRSVEYKRDWNILDNSIQTDEHVLTGGIGFHVKEKGNVNYTLSSFLRGDRYRGYQHGVESQYYWNGFRFMASGSYTSSQDDYQAASFFRPRLDLSKRLGRKEKHRIGFYKEIEDNQINNFTASDSLVVGSFKYDISKIYLSSNPNDTQKLSYLISALRRVDFIPRNGKYALSAEAISYNAQTQYQINPQQLLSFNLSYRDLTILDTQAINASGDDRAALGRIEYSAAFGKGVIRTATLYEIASGQERKREFSYIEVVNGLGQYAWIDINENGVKELDEFQRIDPRLFPDKAIYQRVQSFTNEFIPTHELRFNEVFSLNPGIIWSKKQGVLNFLSKYSTQSTIQLQKKLIPNDDIQLVEPLFSTVSDTTLITSNSLLRNSIYYNRNRGNLGLEYTHIYNNTKNTLTTGNQSRVLQENQYRMRLNLSRSFSFLLQYRQGVNQSNSEQFANNQYQINYQKIIPELNWIYSNKLRTILTYEYDIQNNIKGIQASSFANKGSLEAKYNNVGKGIYSTRLSYVSINFSGEKSSTVGFTMLEGLEPGENILWNMNFQKNLGKNMQLILTYDGRYSAQNDITIHIGRAQVRAIF